MQEEKDVPNEAQLGTVITISKTPYDIDVSDIEIIQGGCFINSHHVAERYPDVEIVEGVILSVGTDNLAITVKHVWNRRGNIHFDITKDRIWEESEELNDDESFMYFAVKYHNQSEFSDGDIFEYCFETLVNFESIKMYFWEKRLNILKNKITDIRIALKEQKDFENNPIDLNLPIIPPFKRMEEVKLLVIGQDPTVKNAKSRQRINCTLNLDKKGSLRTYLESICHILNITIDNVYATNVFKYFYSIPPANTMEVLFSHLEPNLELLKEELMEFPNIPIITLGEPILQLLVDEDAKVRDYWGYDMKTKKTNGGFKYSSAIDNKLGRDFYPMPHQPSIRKEFYRNNLSNYVSFIKNNI